MKQRPLSIQCWCGRLSTAVSALCCLVAGGLVVQGQSFTNTSALVLPLGGPAAPYPSGISVSGLTGSVVRVTVRLNDIVHTLPDDLDVVLLGPGGQTVMLMSDAGGTVFLGGVDLRFDQNSAVTLADSGPITSGSYRPTDYEAGDILPGTAPAGPYGTDLGVFTGTDPNGTWRLYVADDTSAVGDGSIGGGWSLSFDVATPPTITSQPLNQTVAPGDTAVFSVGVAGTPPFGYQWRRNGEVIVPFGVGGPALTVANVQPTNAGAYSVVITNSAAPGGVASSEAFLQVTGPLTLVEPPADQVAAPGQDITFRVTASGTPPVFYQWRLNGALLSGQTNASLRLTNVQADQGGGFSVTVWNAEDALTTGQALLTVPDSSGPVGADDFASRPLLNSPTEFQGILQGNSATATSEPGEPVAEGGGQSVWYEWVAPSDGIVSLSLLGSAFDTLLGVYQGTVLSNLTRVTTDDDQGGYFTSKLSFNALRGEHYQWSIDGFGVGGDGGDYTLSWAIQPTTQRVPVIVTHPASQGVQTGSNATFSVVTETAALDGYQWLFNGIPLVGATNSLLTITNVQSADVGVYAVRVQNEQGNVKQSPPAILQQGSQPHVFGFDKLSAGEMHQLSQPLALSVGLGDTDWNEFPSEANGSPGDPNPCQQPFLKTLYQAIHADDSGLIRVDTVGSQVYALLAIYDPSPGALIPLLVGCDTTNGIAEHPALVEFNATEGSNYTAVVAVLTGNSNDIIRITASMGVAPPIPENPPCVAVPFGASHPLQVPAHGWNPPPAVQWQYNGDDIEGATADTLNLMTFDVTQAGTYSVVLSNFVDVITNTVAHVAQSGPPVLQAGIVRHQNNPPEIVVAGSGDLPFVLQSASVLPGPWSNVATNPDPCFPLWYTNANPLLDEGRFYRATLWDPPL